jgi:hypothetical protein
MKEITRRLYRKPVMLGLAFLVAMGLLVGFFVTANSRASTSIFIAAGDDEFETTGNGETYHSFSEDNIPENFFGPGSQAYSGVVPLVGVPLNPAVSDIDTVIHREVGVTVPGTTPITMNKLSLKSINPITVTYPSGTESWEVYVGLSALKASTGSMTIEDGGTFDSSLKVWPKFTFKRIPDGLTKELDTGSGSSLMASSLTLNESGDFETGEEPVPVPAPTIAPCPEVASDETAVQHATVATVSDASAGSSCPPVTLTSNNSPWAICNGKFCIPRPITEAELLASHNASPPGTKKRIAVKVIGVASQ